MYDILKQKLKGDLTNEEKIHITREYLQVMTLKIMFDKGFFNNLAFVGGTALRILFGLKCYSEDLDFCLIERKGYDFRNILDGLLFEFKNYGFKAETQGNERNDAYARNIAFPELLDRLKISHIKGQSVSIRLEIDTKPPEGWKTSVTSITDSFMFAVKHFDLPSLFATKLHSCFFRKYTKGRDFYDLVWYLGQKIEPNYVLLNNGIKQTEKSSIYNINAQSLKRFIYDKIQNADFDAVQEDVKHFLQDRKELKMLNKENTIQMILK